MSFSDYIVFVDESGDHSLKSIDVNYPVFVLAFCIFEKAGYTRVVAPAVQTFKFHHFGHDAIILHEHEIRKQMPPFVFLKSEGKREPFLAGLGQLIADAPMTIIAAAIDKQLLVRRYPNPRNPYEIALKFCMERLYAYLRTKGAHKRKTHVIVECRGKREDSDLELEFRRIAGGSNRWGPLTCMDIVFADKRMNLAGLQIADLTARPIGLKLIRPLQQNRAFDILSRKFRSSPNGSIEGWGFKVFP